MLQSPRRTEVLSTAVVPKRRGSLIGLPFLNPLAGFALGGVVGAGSRPCGGVTFPGRRSWCSAGILGPLLLMFGLSKTSAASGSLLLNLEELATLGSPGRCSAIMLIDGADRACGDRHRLHNFFLAGRGSPTRQWRHAHRGPLPKLGDRQQSHPQAPPQIRVQIATIKGLAACMTSFALALFLGAQRSCLGQERCSAVQRSVSSASA